MSLVEANENQSSSDVQGPKSRARTEEELVEFDKLFQAVMKNKWEEVVTAYKMSPKAREARLIRKSEDTALHIAVSNGQTNHALNLVDTIDKDLLKRIRNAKGNTPLHLAAVHGDLKICKKMVSKNPDLMGVRNKDGETPIFLAARHGQSKIFFYLHNKEFHKNDEYLRRDNGDTILHVAISGEFFSMAMQIIEEHKNLVDAMNEDGLTPLHVLANKPNAFKSGTQLGAFDRFIYYCTFVDIGTKEEVATQDKKKIEKYRKNMGGDDGEIGDYPKNYECMNFIDFLLNKLCLVLIRYLIPTIVKTWTLHQWNKLLESCTRCLHVLKKRKNGNPDDEEIAQQTSSSEQLGLPEGPSTTTLGSNQLKKYNEQAVASSSSATGQEKTENTTEESKQSMQGNCFSKFCVEEVDMDKSRNRLFPPNYDSVVLFLKLVMKFLLFILGVGIWRIEKIQRKKKLHLWAKRVTDELVKHTTSYKFYDNTGWDPTQTRGAEELAASNAPFGFFSDRGKNIPETSSSFKYEGKAGQDQHENIPETSSSFKYEGKAGQDEHEATGKRHTPILIAAKMGVTEMVEKILEEFPVAIQDLDSENKNVVLLAVENRQPEVYNLLLQSKIMKESVFRHLDKDGNSALHLAAQCKEQRPWLIPGVALHIQWEMKWYKFVKESMPPESFPRYNLKHETPEEIFISTHKDLTKEGREWLVKTSESYSVVAALIATVAFATSSTIPGGANQNTGIPLLLNKPAFHAFAISSLVAFYFSMTALVFFLLILTSRCQEKDFAMNLPRKLLLGLTSLFVSITSIVISFCDGHIFILPHNLKHVAYPLYAALCFPIAFFALANLSPFFDLVWAIYRKVPQRCDKVFVH